SDEGFARECLGMWSAAATNSPIDLKTWAANAADFSGPEWMWQIVSKPAIGVDVAPDNAKASISVAGRRQDGRPIVEWVETRVGIGWVVDYIKAMHRKERFRGVVIDEGSPSKVLIEPLEKAKIPVIRVGASYMGTSCAGFYESAMSSMLVHLDQPTLNSAVADARKRNIGTEGLW